MCEGLCQGRRMTKYRDQPNTSTRRTACAILKRTVSTRTVAHTHTHIEQHHSDLSHMISTTCIDTAVIIIYWHWQTGSENPKLGFIGFWVFCVKHGILKKAQLDGLKGFHEF